MNTPDFHLDARYHYSLLPEWERSYYRTVIERLAKFEFILPLPEDIRVNAYDVFEAIRWDFPEFFHISVGDLCLHTDEEDTLCLRVDGGITYTREEFDALNAQLDGILRGFDGIDDPFEIELAAYEYAIRSFEYEHDEGSLSEHEFQEIFTVVGLLRRGRAVCGAFTRFVQFILQQRGILAANIVTLGMADEGEEAKYHSWLAVRIDGEFYHLDVTFDEGDEKDPEFFPYAHFNITDDEADDDHNLRKEEYPGIVCRATAANYYYRKGLYFKTDDEIVEGVRRFVTANADTDEEKLYFYFRLPPGTPSEGMLDRILDRVDCAKTVWKAEMANDDALGRHYFLLYFRKNKPKDAE